MLDIRLARTPIDDLVIDDPDAIVREARRMRAQAQRAIRRMLDPHAVYTRLFLGPDGQPTQDALAFLEGLGRAGFADRSTYDPDPRQHARNEGRRDIYLTIMRGLRLDAQRLAALTRQARELDDDE